MVCAFKLIGLRKFKQSSLCCRIEDLSLRFNFEEKYHG